MNLILLYLFLNKIYNYEHSLYLKIKMMIFYKFKNIMELREAVDLYTERSTFQKAYDKYFHISLWDTSLITDMSYLFIRKHTFNENLNSDVSRVEDMQSMFEECYNYNKPMNFGMLKKSKILKIYL